MEPAQWESAKSCNDAGSTVEMHGLKKSHPRELAHTPLQINKPTDAISGRNLSTQRENKEVSSIDICGTQGKASPVMT